MIIIVIIFYEPEPVFATEMMSLPSSAMGHESAWMGEGVSNPSFFKIVWILGANGVWENTRNGEYFSVLVPLSVTWCSVKNWFAKSAESFTLSTSLTVLLNAFTREEIPLIRKFLVDNRNILKYIKFVVQKLNVEHQDLKWLAAGENQKRQLKLIICTFKVLICPNQ